MGPAEWIAIVALTLTISGALIGWMHAIYTALSSLKNAVTTIAAKLEAMLQRLDSSDDDRHHIWERLAEQEKTIGDLRVNVARLERAC